MTEKVTISKKEPYIIHPNEFVLASCLEWVEWTDDLAAYLSADTWQNVLLPYNKRLRDHFDWASLHMCGHTDHLLEIFTKELGINEYQGFGWEVNLDKVAEIMGGKVVLLGNVNPLLIAEGTPDQVKQATRQVIEKLAPCGGLIIQDGNNIAPGSPVENINNPFSKKLYRWSPNLVTPMLL